MSTSVQNPMKSLYKRLRDVGFDTAFVRQTALPGWWDDELATSPSGFQEALMYLSRHLGISLASLQSESFSLELRDLGPCNFKRSSNKTESDLTVAKAICTRAAQLAASSFESPWQELVPVDGSTIRDEILEAGAPWVGLKELVDWCWNKGIPVLHVLNFPKNAKKMDGMVALIEGRPVIILCKNERHEAWMLFILAHELGHIVRGHVSKNGILIDEHVDKDNVDREESEANATAIEILTGNAKCRIFSSSVLSAPKLADAASRFGESNQVDPGHIILNYVRNKGDSFFPLGNAALKNLYPNADAARHINEIMSANLNTDGLPGDSAEYLMRVTTVKQR